MEAYHTASFVSNTGYTRMLTIDLVRMELCSHPVGTLIEDAVRAIAARIGRSAGGISPALKRLAADGWISYLSDRRGSLVEVLRSDQATDRPVLPTQTTPEAHLASVPAAPPMQGDQPTDRLSAEQVCDQRSDRSACMDDHDSLIQEEENRARESSIAANPLYQRLIAEPSMNWTLAQQIVTQGIGTLADFMHDLRLAQADASLRRPFYVVVSRWSQGQRFTAAEEARDVHSPTPARRDGAGARRRFDTHQRHGYAPPEPNEERDREFNAALAEFERIAAERRGRVCAV